MSRYDPQRRRRLTTRANTTAVESLLDGEPTRPRRHTDDESGPVRAGAEQPSPNTPSPNPPSETPLEARSGCLTGLLTLGRR